MDIDEDETDFMWIFKVKKSARCTEILMKAAE